MNVAMGSSPLLCRYGGVNSIGGPSEERDGGDVKWVGGEVDQR